MYYIVLYPFASYSPSAGILYTSGAGGDANAVRWTTVDDRVLEGGSWAYAGGPIVRRGQPVAFVLRRRLVVLRLAPASCIICLYDFLTVS